MVQALWSGMFCALSYLTYTSSYIAYPVIVTIGILAYIRSRSSDVAIALRKFSILVLFILAPFIAHAILVDNYFLERISQVNVFWGSWSDTARTHASPVSIAATQSVSALRSLVIPGIGGLGGYNFGNQSLLDPLTGVLFILGLGILVSDAIRKKREDALSILIVFVVPFITGFILTTHPPPFHRISLLYPFFALVIAWPIWSLTKLKKPVGLLLMALVLALVATMNVRHIRAMILGDANLYPQNSRIIGDFINRTVPKGETIFIAAYPSFYLGQELVFRTNNRYLLTTEESEGILKRYNGKFLIVFQPSEIVINKLTSLYPANRWVTSLEGIPLGDVALFVPK